MKTKQAGTTRRKPVASTSDILNGVRPAKRRETVARADTSSSVADEDSDAD